jgi:mono/diheme cytochrome c family protein
MSEAIKPASETTPMPGGELTAGRSPVPVWLVFLLFVLLYWAMVYFDQRSGWLDQHVYTPYTSIAELQLYQPAAGGSKDRGRAIYDNLCALCHNPDGAGKPGQAPPFVKSDWVLGNPNRLIRIPLVGLSGPILVNGQEWNLSMPAMGAALSDEDLAAVLTYMRQSWGNEASEITPEQVKAIRAEVGTRSQAYSAAELMSLP